MGWPVSLVSAPVLHRPRQLASRYDLRISCSAASQWEKMRAVFCSRVRRRKSPSHAQILPRKVIRHTHGICE